MQWYYVFLGDCCKNEIVTKLFAISFVAVYVYNMEVKLNELS